MGFAAKKCCCDAFSKVFDAEIRPEEALFDDMPAIIFGQQSNAPYVRSI